MLVLELVISGLALLGSVSCCMSYVCGVVVRGEGETVDYT